MAVIPLDIYPLFAGLRPNGGVFLRLAIGDDDHVSEVEIPPSAEGRRLAREVGISLDLDDLPQVAPVLAREINEFISMLRHRLTVRAIGS